MSIQAIENQESARIDDVVQRGERAALPIILGYFPLAFAYGVLATQAGLSVLAVTAMSVFVYAGAAQFIAASMLTAGATPVAVVTATLVVNLRHLLMSAAVGPRLQRLSHLRVAAIAFHLTDETFAVMSLKNPGEPLPPRWLAGLQWGAYLSWVVGSFSGALAGSAVSEPARWGLDFALTGMFIALLAMQVRRRSMLLVAVFGAVVYRVACLIVSGHWAIIVAALMAATFGLVLPDDQPRQR